MARALSGGCVAFVGSGKLRYLALAIVPVWYATKMAVLAEARGVAGPIAVQTHIS